MFASINRKFDDLKMVIRKLPSAILIGVGGISSNEYILTKW